MSSIHIFTQNGPYPKEEAATQRQLNRLNETLNDFVIGSKTNAKAIAEETSELQTNCLSNDFERITVGDNAACQVQVIRNNFDDKIIKAVDIAFMTVENRVIDVILTAMDNVVKPRIEMAEISHRVIRAQTL